MKNTTLKPANPNFKTIYLLIGQSVYDLDFFELKGIPLRATQARKQPNKYKRIIGAETSVWLTGSGVGVMMAPSTKAKITAHFHLYWLYSRLLARMTGWL